MESRRNQGFTLIEVVVVMAIIAVLAVLVVGAIRVARNTATETQHRADAKTIQTWLEAYYAKNKSYPGLVRHWCFNEINSAVDPAGNALFPPGSELKLSSTGSGCVGGVALWNSSSTDWNTTTGWDEVLGWSLPESSYWILPLNPDNTLWLKNDMIVSP